MTGAYGPVKNFFASTGVEPDGAQDSDANEEDCYEWHQGSGKSAERGGGGIKDCEHGEHKQKQLD
ncbi:MAG TPA: hypothetical protein VIC06_01290 [Solirubrobacteraceae bacterium]